MAHQILKRTGRQFEVFRSYEIVDKAIYMPQMSDDSDWVSFVASDEDLFNIRRVRNIIDERKPTKNLILLEWEKEDRSFTRHQLDTIEGIITFRLFDDGSEIIWNTQ